MQVKLTGHSGFCFGVKRAINIAEQTLNGSGRGQAIYSLGPIIHNPQVVAGLSKKGLNVVKDIEGIKRGTVIISSHGAPREVIQRVKKKKIKLIDATCPFVKYAQDIVKDLKKKGYRIVIIGDKIHPEVKALLSLAGQRIRPVKKAGSLKGIAFSNEVKSKKIGIISQTTQNKDDYLKGILDILKEDFSEVRIFNTICNDTSRRQELTRNLLNKCDLMIVVGGKNSANTKRLWQICKESGVDSYHIERDAELKKSYLAGKRCVGVVSGASTSEKTVKRVVQKINSLN